VKPRATLVIVLAAAFWLVGCGSAQPDARVRQTDPLAGLKLWVNPETPAAIQRSSWREAGDVEDARLVGRIADRPTAVWLTGASQPADLTSVTVGEAARGHGVAQIVLYDIPDRDCGQYSAGGAPSGPAYLQWVSQVVHGLGDHRVIIILEPDAVDQAASGCLGSEADADLRYGVLADASRLLRSDPRASIYLDAGDAGWLSPGQLAEPLRRSGIAGDAGFALNVSNFYSTSTTVAYGMKLSKLLRGKHFLIDTSRNGNGAPAGQSGVNEWCNPPGRALGHAPTTDTGLARVDAFLWIKFPGESDGNCGPGDPPAGTWWPAYALGLVQDAQR
jgi:endoglucanase